MILERKHNTYLERLQKFNESTTSYEINQKLLLRQENVQQCIMLYKLISDGYVFPSFFLLLFWAETICFWERSLNTEQGSLLSMEFALDRMQEYTLDLTEHIFEFSQPAFNTKWWFDKVSWLPLKIPNEFNVRAQSMPCFVPMHATWTCWFIVYNLEVRIAVEWRRTVPMTLY